MVIRVRLNGSLSSLVGRPNLTVSLQDPASVADLIAPIAEQSPDAEDALSIAVPVSGGEVISRQMHLQDGQEIGLLMPISGG